LTILSFPEPTASRRSPQSLPFGNPALEKAFSAPSSSPSLLPCQKSSLAVPA
jgi:hypothetical protein